MDEELNDEPTRLEVAEGVQHDDYSLNPSCPKILNPQEIHDDIRQGKTVVEAINHVVTSPHLRPSPLLDDGGGIVEELTVKSYNGSTLDIGTSNNNRELMHNEQNQWRHLYQLASDSGMGNIPNETGYRNSVKATSGSVWEDFRSTTFPGILARKSPSDDQSNVMEHLKTVDHKAEHKEDAGDTHGGIRTKIISKSGFAEYFIKNTLKGKGIVCKGPSSNGLCIGSRDQNLIKSGFGTRMNSNVSLSSGPKTTKSTYNATVPRSGGSDCDGVTLREWLKAGHCKGSKAERLRIFRKIVDLVDGSHSRGVALHHLCPSYIKLLPSNHVMYLGLPLQNQMSDSVANSEVLQLDSSFIRKRLSEQVLSPSLDMWSKKKKVDENVRVAGDSKVNAVGSQDYCNEYKEDIQFSKHHIWGVSSIPHISNAGRLQLTSLNERLEGKWYTSPEGGCTTSSNIYCLGVLLFEVCSLVDESPLYYLNAIFLCFIKLLITQN